VENGEVMDRLREWTATARNGTILRRALVTSFVVGTLLTVVNHGDELARIGLQPHQIWRIIFTFAIPFVVALTSSVATVHERHD
jgi:hypothetical protein